MGKIASEEKNEIRTMVYNFFAEECEKEIGILNDTTNVIDDLDGDSLLFIELLQMTKKKYGLNVSMQSIGKFLLKNRAETIGKVIELLIHIVENESEFA